MEIIRTQQAMQEHSRILRREGKTIGFVPTMGFLHEGHLSLMHLAREKTDIVVATVFINPTQFGPNEDIDAYPRDFERDQELCGAANVNLLFVPTAGDLYFEDHSVWVDEGSLSKGLCGASRAGHFRGVCTVVAKLLNIVQPDLMVLGEKDAQQLCVLRRMVRDLNFPVKIVAGPTIREPDGLAMSSRNQTLSPIERAEAVCLFQGLEKAKALFSEGERDADVLKVAIRETIEKTSGSIDYIEIVEDESLESVQGLNLSGPGSAPGFSRKKRSKGMGEKPLRVALAVKFSGARLIDNIVLGGRR